MAKILFTSNILLDAGREVGISADEKIATLKKIALKAKEHDILVIGERLILSPSSPTEKMEEIFSKIRENCMIILAPSKEERSSADYLAKLESLPHDLIFRNGDERFSIERDDERITLIHSKIADTVCEDDFTIAITDEDIDVCAHSPAKLFQNRRGVALFTSPLEFKMIKSGEKTVALAPGGIEPVDEDDSGSKYLISATIKKREISELKRLVVNCFTVTDVIIDCTEFKSFEDIISSVADLIDERTIAKVTLTGKRSFPIDYERSAELKAKKVSICNRSEATFDMMLREKSGEETLKGEFFSQLRIALESAEDIDVGTLESIIRKMEKSERLSEDELCKICSI